MKKVFILLLSIVLLSCHKEETSEPPLIVGEWAFKDCVAYDPIYSGDTPLSASTDEKLLRFEMDGKLYINGDRVFTYSVENGYLTRTQIGGKETTTTFHIETLNDEELVLLREVGGGMIVYYTYNRVK